MKTPLRYQPGIVTGTAVGAVLALLIYYKVLDVEGASLWGALLALVIPPIQGWIAQHFTMPVAKIEDAGLHPATITAQATVARRARKRGEA